MKHCCKNLRDAINNDDEIMIYVSNFREYGIIIHDGGSAFMSIDYCPWCGTKLPESLRDEWFDTLEAKGLDTDAPPEEYQTDKWWKKVITKS